MTSGERSNRVHRGPSWAWLSCLPALVVQFALVVALVLALGLLIAAPAAGQSPAQWDSAQALSARTRARADSARAWAVRAVASADSLTALLSRYELIPPRVDTIVRVDTVTVVDTVFVPVGDSVIPLPPVLDTTVVELDIPGSGLGVLVGQTVQLTAVARDSSGAVRSVAVGWVSRQPGIATVDANGLARGVAPGRAIIVGQAQLGRDSVPLDVVAPPPPDSTPPTPGECSRTVTGAIDGNLVAVAGERLCVGADLRVAGNVLVQDATLVMRPGARLTFVGANPSSYVGGGMNYTPALDSDRGVWVWGSGQLDVQCTPKRAWNRTGVDPTWLPSDEYWVTPTAAGDYLPRRWTPGQPVPRADPSVPAAEVLNATRDCSITGPGHVHVNSSRPQRVEYLRLTNMGVGFRPDRSEILGRYALHLHMSGEGTRGTIVRGVVAVDSKAQVFVPHSSHGVTMIDNVSVNSLGEVLWWDPGHATNDLLVQGMVAAGVYADRSLTNVASRRKAFSLQCGSNMTLRGSVATGVRDTDLSVGFDWPEPVSGLYAPCRQAGGELVWDFAGDNVAHNNYGPGIRFWTNGTLPHLVEEYLGYRNREAGIENGAYINGNVYRDVTLFGERALHHTSPRPNDDGQMQGYANLVVRNPSGPAFYFGHRNIAVENPAHYTEITDCTLEGSPKVLVEGTSETKNPARARFIRCNLTPDDIVFQASSANNGSHIILLNADGSGWDVRYTNGQKVVTPR